MLHARSTLLVFCVLVAAPATAVATTWIVELDSPQQSIQAAIDAASAGDEVLVMPGDYHETLVLKDGVDVRADTPGTVTVDGENDGSVVRAEGVGAGTLIEGLRFVNGSTERGGALWAIASATAFVPASNGGISKTPMGPFQTTVLASLTACAYAFADSGPISSP